MKDYPAESSDSSTPSSPTDRPLVVHHLPVRERQITTSSSTTDRPLAIHHSPVQEQQIITSSPLLLNDNTTCSVNKKQRASSKSTNRSSTASKKKLPQQGNVPSVLKNQKHYV